MTPQEWNLWRNYRLPFVCARLAACLSGVLTLQWLGVILLYAYSWVQDFVTSRTYAQDTGIGLWLVPLLIWLGGVGFVTLAFTGVTYGLWKLKSWAWWTSLTWSFLVLLILACIPQAWWLRVDTVLLMVEIVLVILSTSLFRDRADME